MYKVKINVVGSYSQMEFRFKTMKQAADFVDKCFESSKDIIECHIVREEAEDGK